MVRLKIDGGSPEEPDQLAPEPEPVEPVPAMATAPSEPEPAPEPEPVVSPGGVDSSIVTREVTTMLFRNPVRATIRPNTAPPRYGLFRVTQPFGCTGVRQEPAYGTCRHFHRGIDLGNGKCGEKVVAAEAGKVRVSTVTRAGEHIIVLNHGRGWVSMYGHLSSRKVVKGERVRRGQVLGIMGSTGSSTACHLHFQVKSEVERGENVYRDDVGKMHDPWPLLEQNVACRPVGPGVNIRASAGEVGTTNYGSLFASTSPSGQIVRKADGVDLGETAAWRSYGGTVKGATWTVGGVTSDLWVKMLLDGGFKYVAKALVELSAS